MSLIVTTAFELNRIAAPNLPRAPEEYSTLHQNQLNNVLRLYFNRLDNLVGQLTASSFAAGLVVPYGAFSSNQDQSTTANTATLMTLNTTDFSNEVSISSSKITVANAGIYNLQFSGQFQNTDNQIQDISIWLKQNGTDIAGSMGLVSIPARKSASAGEEAHEIVGWNYYVQMQASDYIEIYWSATNASVTIQYYSAPTSPVRPSTQSVVATLSFVSAIPA
tara:strand:- start:12346 stop:13008 length:663 start_codon:yes stop_codon:yes gene_type:complete